MLHIDEYNNYIECKTNYAQLKNNIIGGNKPKSAQQKSNDNLTIDFDNIKVIKRLGAGMLGTTYLVTYNGKDYAQKIQHILAKDRKKDFNNEMWRELDLYDYINCLNQGDQKFFTKLHGYKIYDNCLHDQSQERPFKMNLNDKKNKFAQRLKKLDESDWCVTYLLDYKGKATLSDFLQKHFTLDTGLIYSLVLQICKITHVLYQAGYSHSDLHTGNIMINKTNDKYFDFMGKKISYRGYQLSAIDYGEVLHKKFNIKYKAWRKTFLLDRKFWLFRETFYSSMAIFDGLSRMVAGCKKRNKIMPWDRKGNVDDDATKKMIINHPDFYKMVKDKYIKQFPLGEKLLNHVVQAINNNKIGIIRDAVRKKKNKNDFWNIMDRIVCEFGVFFPEEYSKYWKWCTHHDSMLSKDVMQDILLINNYDDFVGYFIKQSSQL